MGQAREELVAPLDFKHLTLTKNKPGEDDETNYYAQKRKRQYHGNESANVKELSMKPDKKLPNLRVPVKGKKGVSKFMRKKAAATAKDDINAQKNPKIDEALKPISTLDQVKAAIKIARDKRFNMKSQIDKKTAIEKISKDLLKDPKVKKELDKIYEESEVDEGLTPDQMMRMHQQAAASQKKNQQKRDEKEKKSMAAKAAVDMKARNEETEDDVDEALTLQQRMKRSRMMRRMRTRIKVGRERAKRKMANKEKLEKRARRQARNMLAKKLTRGIPKAELTFARKKEIEKRLEKPALQARIKRIAKRIFKDVRKKEVQRKKG